MSWSRWRFALSQDDPSALRRDGPVDGLPGFLDGFFRRFPDLSSYRRKLNFREKGKGSSPSHGEARQHGNEVWIFPKFWSHSQETQDFILIHEIGHWVLSNFGLRDFISLASSKGIDPWDTSSLPFAQHNMDEAFADSFASAYTDKDVFRRYPAWAELVSLASSGRKTATKDDYEREEEEVEKMVTPSPKHRPPRRDLEKNKINDKDTRPEERDKDLSLNYKDSAWHGWRFAQDESEPDWAQGKKFKHPSTTNQVSFGSLPPDEQARLREEHDKEQSEDDDVIDPTTMVEDPDVDPESSTESEDPKPQKTPKLPEGLSVRSLGKLEQALNKFSPEEQQEFRDSFDEVVATLAAENPTATAAYRNEVEEFESGKQDLSPTELANALARAEFFHKVADNPLFDAHNPLPDKNDVLPPAPQELRKRGDAAIAAYGEMDKEHRRKHFERIQSEIESLPEKSSRRKHLETVARGIALVSAVEEGDSVKGVASTVIQLAKAAHKSGNLGDLLGVDVRGSASPDNQAAVRKIYESLSDDDWTDIIDDQHPARPLLDVLSDPDRSRFLSPADRESVRQHLTDLMLAETAFLGANEEEAVGADAPASERSEWAKRKRLSAAPKTTKFDTKDTMIDWLKSFIKSLSRTGKPKKGSGLGGWIFLPLGLQ